MLKETDEKRMQFLPFHAINEFMRNDYRVSVVRTTLHAMSELSGNLRSPIDRLTRKAVKVPGFRNSAKAPISVRVKPTAEAFEKNPQVVTAILSAWSEIHSELRQKVYDLLDERNWEVLPPEADRTKLPGFMTVWPKDENFDVLGTAFNEKYPEAQTSSDDISLMIVWVGMRLPYQFEEDDEINSEEPSSE